MTACSAIDSCEEAPKVPMCVEECVAMHESLTDEPACFDAKFALTVCVGGLDCEGLMDYYEGDEPPYPCFDEEQALCW